MIQKISFNCNLFNRKEFLLEIMGLILLLSALCPPVAAENLKLGMVFPATEKFAYLGIIVDRGIRAAAMEYDKEVSFESGNFFNCQEAIAQANKLIEQKIQALAGMADNGACNQEISAAAKGKKILYLSLSFDQKTKASHAQPWLKILNSEAVSKPWQHIINIQIAETSVMSLEKRREYNLIAKIEQLLSFVPSAESIRYKVHAPYAGLRKEPEKPGRIPGKDNVMIAKLKKNDTVITHTPCKREDHAWDWIYTKDWICVRHPNSDKIGWVHRMLLTKAE